MSRLSGIFHTLLTSIEAMGGAGRTASLMLNNSLFVPNKSEKPCNNVSSVQKCNTSNTAKVSETLGDQLCKCFSCMVMFVAGCFRHIISQKTVKVLNV